MLISKRVFYTLLLCFLVVICSAQTNVLDKSLSISLSKTPLKEALRIIEKQADCTFAYKASTLNKDRLVSVDQVDISLSDVLKILLFDDGVQFSAIGFQVIIYEPEHSNEKQTVHKEPVRDTIWTQVTNTVYVTDTNYVLVMDTVRVMDTTVVKRIVKEKVTYSKREKENLISVEYGGSYRQLSMDVSAPVNVEWERSWQAEQSLTVQYGKVSDHWELCAGIGLAQVNRSFSYSDSWTYNWVEHDSTLHADLMVDSAYIAIPGVDTTWMTEPRVNKYYTYSSEEKYETRTEHFSYNQKLLYWHIPVSISYRKKLNRKTSFLCRFKCVTSILMSSAPLMSFVDIHSNELGSIETFAMTLQGVFQPGIEYSLKGNRAVSGFAGAQFYLSPLATGINSSISNTVAPKVSLGFKQYF